MINFADLLAAIRYRSRFILVVGGATCLLVLVLAMLQPRGYTAASSLLIDLTNDTENSRPPDSPLVVDTIIGTQMDIIRSDAVLNQVALSDPAFSGARYGDTPKEKAQTAVGEIRRNLALDFDKGSNVVRMSYTARSPVDAARILNLIGDTYLSKQVALRTASARQEMEWYAGRTREARARLEDSQRILTDFQQKSGIVGVNRMDLEADRARNLSTELVRAQADAAEASGRSGASNDPSVVQSDIVQNLERDLGEQSSRVAQLARQLGPNHPTMKAAQAQMASLQSSLAAARSAQTRALSSASASAGRRVAEVKSELDQQQGRLIKMSGVQDKLNVLQRDVDAARDTYDTVRKKLNQAELRSEISQATASRLDRATPPSIPSKPFLMLWFLAAIILGVSTGLMAACALEIFRPRVRTANGAAQALQLDIISDMTRPRQLTQSTWTMIREKL